MTDREAIAMLEGCACTPVMRKAINKGISALQEREERARGCEYCNNKELPTEGGIHDFRILGDAIYYYDDAYGWEGTLIEYCPHCGKQLKGVDNGT